MYAFILLAALAAPDIEPPEIHGVNDELRGYLMEAADNHPTLKARYEQWEAALQRIPQAESLDDPMLGFTQFLQSNDYRFAVMLEQKLPWFGRLRARGDEAAAQADAALANLYVARNDLFARVKTAYFEYAYLADRAAVLEDQIDLLETMEESLEAVYEVGLVRLDDLLRIEIEITRLRDEYNQITDLRPAAAARLSEALGRESAELLPWPGESVQPPEPPPAPIVAAQLRVANPELKELDHMIESQRHAVTLARLQRRPDVTLGLEYMNMRSMRPPPPVGPTLDTAASARRLATGAVDTPLGAAMDVNTLASFPDRVSARKARDDIMVSVRVNLPIWRKRIDAGIAEAKAEERAIELEQRALALELERDARMALFELQDAKRRHNLRTDSLIPQAEDAYESLEGNYISGVTNVNFIDVLDAQRMLLDFELERVRALRDWHVAATELERILGGPWSGNVTGDLPGEVD